MSPELSVWTPAKSDSARAWLAERHIKSGTLGKWLVNRYQPVCAHCHEFWPCPVAVLLEVSP